MSRAQLPYYHAKNQENNKVGMSIFYGLLNFESQELREFQTDPTLYSENNAMIGRSIFQRGTV